MNRRTLLGTAAFGALSFSLSSCGGAQPLRKADIEQGLREFGDLSPNAAVSISIQGEGGRRQHYAHKAQQPLFVGSAVKTFILGQYLKEVEAGRLAEDTQVEIGPRVWSPGSPVFIGLQGSTTAKSVLEAMIAHSDNTATDVAMNAVGADKVRELIKAAGLNETRIPDSTRKLFSYLAGAPSGTDIGWSGMLDMQNGKSPGSSRPPINPHQTMLSTASDMTRWYDQVLAGGIFKKPETLAEFKRISAMADAMPMMVPADTMAYGKGGSIDWEDFHCFCVAGQMVQPTQRSSFCFIVNWKGSDESVPGMFKEFKERGRRLLQGVAA
ncbi:serine hydrolase [Pollutimonas sp. H1-120]|uniref:serine hydrolase n=1 Tax=Pollutimonas sp. H1-120 TaxID=3148824 RepID=UPI003B52B397